jgi:hypothetical protein
MFEVLNKIVLPVEIETALEHGANLVISISGGKDSDAMAELLPLLGIIAIPLGKVNLRNYSAV